MKLVELCEDVFQEICLLNRSARKGAPLEMTSVRSKLKSLLSKTRSRASTDPMLAQQYDSVERPLVYFIDFMIEESSLPFAGQWRKNRLQNDMYSVNDGDEHFFDMLDETLGDTRREATERLAVYYTCLGLGFTGFYAGQPEFLRRKMMEMNARLREIVNTETRERIVPEAYAHTDTSNLVPAPAGNLIGLLVGVAAVVVSLIGFSVYLYWDQTGELARSLDRTEKVLRAEPLTAEDLD